MRTAEAMGSDPGPPVWDHVDHTLMNRDQWMSAGNQYAQDASLK